jgi:hypothetical protein
VSLNPVHVLDTTLCDNVCVNNSTQVLSQISGKKYSKVIPCFTWCIYIYILGQKLKFYLLYYNAFAGLVWFSEILIVVDKDILESEILIVVDKDILESENIDSRWHIQYMYIVGKYKIYLYKLWETGILASLWRAFQACFAASTN